MERATKEREKGKYVIYRSIHVSYWQDSYFKIDPSKNSSLSMTTNNQCEIYENKLCVLTRYNPRP